MSNGYGCALGDETHKVNWLITHLSPALTVSVCDDDFPLAVIPLLASSLGVDQGRLYESVKRFVDREQDREAREEAKTQQAVRESDPNGMMLPPFDHDQDEADAMASEPDPAPPRDEDDPGPDPRLPGWADEYDADGRPIPADLT